MDPKKYFEQYYSRLRLEAILKSLLRGLIIGLSVTFAAAFAIWFSTSKFLWIAAIAVMAVATTAATLAFYYTRFRPTAMSSARRMDRLGLEERLITMVEYEEDDSYIASAQREDAKAQLKKYDASQIRFRFPKKIVIAVAICAVAALGMTTVTALSGFGVIPNAAEIFDAIIPDPPVKYVSVNYVAEKGGYILGDAEQLIPMGTDAKTIVAVAEDGFMFKGWSDGSKDPSRSDEEISTELTFSAVFIPVAEEKVDESDPDEKADDLPDQQGSGSGGDGPPQEGDGSGKYEHYNQIINGNTYYREVLEGYQDAIDQQLSEDNGDLTEAEKEIIKSYIGIV